MSASVVGAPVAAADGNRRRNYARRYLMFAMPSGLVIAAVIVFPLVFTLFMSLHSWQITGGTTFVGVGNYAHLFSDPRFGWAVLRTLYYTALATFIPVVLGVLAAACFQQNFRLRGLARTVFVLPMMATPVAVALVWTMMFHPQFGVLNYLLTRVGLPPSSWVYNADTVIPTLVMVETWQWTPLVMLIVLGGLASLPQEPYEAAIIDGASVWQTFRHITFPLLWPFIIVATVIRMIDALKAFDIIYVITGGGPGTASETINILLYQTTFSYYDLGYGSAMVVVFSILILAVSMTRLMLRQRQVWH